MGTEHLPGYWPTRILLAIGVAVVAIELALAPTILSPGYMQPLFDDRLDAFVGVPAGIVLYVLTVGASLLGLARMVLVFRGPRDVPPAWRYRAR